MAITDIFQTSLFISFIIFLIIVSSTFRNSFKQIFKHIFHFSASYFIFLGILIFTLLVAFTARADAIFPLVTTIWNEELKPFSFRSHWDWIITNQPTILMIIAPLALLFETDNRVIERYKWLASWWSLYLLIIIFTTGYKWTYRIILLMFFPQLAGIGLVNILDFISTLGIPKTISRRKLETLFMLCLIFWGMSSSLSYGFIHNWVYFNTSIANVLQSIRAIYGFDNNSMLLFVSNRPHSMSSYWYYAIVGSNVHFGSFSDLCALVYEDNQKSVITHRQLVSEVEYRILRFLSKNDNDLLDVNPCLLYTSPSPRDLSTSRMPSSA